MVYLVFISFIFLTLVFCFTAVPLLSVSSSFNNDKSSSSPEFSSSLACSPSKGKQNVQSHHKDTVWKTDKEHSPVSWIWPHLHVHRSPTALQNIQKQWSVVHWAVVFTICQPKSISTFSWKQCYSILVLSMSHCWTDC